METISTCQVDCRVLVTLTHESNSLGECLLDYLRGFRPILHENVFEIADLFLADVGEIAWDWAILASAASYQGGGATFQLGPMVDPISPVNHSVNTMLCQHSTILSTSYIFNIQQYCVITIFIPHFHVSPGAELSVCLNKLIAAKHRFLCANPTIPAIALLHFRYCTADTVCTSSLPPTPQYLFSQLQCLPPNFPPFTIIIGTSCILTMNPF